MRRDSIIKIKFFVLMILGSFILGLSIFAINHTPKREIKSIRQKNIIKDKLAASLGKKFSDKDIDDLMKRYEKFKKKK